MPFDFSGYNRKSKFLDIAVSLKMTHRIYGVFGIKRRIFPAFLKIKSQYSKGFQRLEVSKFSLFTDSPNHSPNTCIFCPFLWIWLKTKSPQTQCLRAFVEI
jgi:hypothetical protein